MSKKHSYPKKKKEKSVSYMGDSRITENPEYLKALAEEEASEEKKSPVFVEDLKKEFPEGLPKKSGVVDSSEKEEQTNFGRLTRIEQNEIKARVGGLFYQLRAGADANTYKEIAEATKEYMALVYLLCPDSRERSLALTSLEECQSWANKAVYRRS